MCVDFQISLEKLGQTRSEQGETFFFCMADYKAEVKGCEGVVFGECLGGGVFGEFGGEGVLPHSIDYTLGLSFDK